jgi:hypothetical protein
MTQGMIEPGHQTLLLRNFAAGDLLRRACQAYKLRAMA